MRGVTAAFLLWALSSAANAVAAGDGFAGTIAAMLLPAGAYHQFHDWHSIERVASVRWAPLPPGMFDESLPDGTYFTRSGAAIVDGRPLDVVATGVRTMVMSAYFRNRGEAIGAAAVTDGLRRRGFAAELVRFPLAASAEADRHWWRIGGGVQPAWLRVSTRCEGEPCEAFALMFEQDLMTMTPAESRVYSDRCPPDATAMRPPLPPWDEQLAALLAGLVPMPGAFAARREDLDTLPRTRWNALPVLERVGTPDDARFARVGQADLPEQGPGICAPARAESHQEMGEMPNLVGQVPQTRRPEPPFMPAGAQSAWEKFPYQTASYPGASLASRRLARTLRSWL